MQYTLESLKKKVAHAFIDRLPFIHDASVTVDLASSIFDDECPAIDCGLRNAIIAQVLARLPIIMDDETAWEAYSGNRTVLKALHEAQCTMEEQYEDNILTPPVSPVKNKKKARAQDRLSGG
jgi:hypothetical protein